MGLIERSPKIESSLNETKNWLGVAPEADWLGPLYQSANRLAHLYFFREVAKVPAWLVNVCFTEDTHSPTTLDAWKAGYDKIHSELGLSGIDLPYASEVYLPGQSREELLG